MGELGGALTVGEVFIMQCGLGWGEARFAAMGANIRTRPSAFEEALDIVRRLLAGETVSSSSSVPAMRWYYSGVRKSRSSPDAATSRANWSSTELAER